MGQFKPMTKMMTTEPSVELKLKKGGHVSMKGKSEHDHKSMPHMMDGGLTPAMSASMPARGGMMPTATPAKPPMAARRKAMALMAPKMKKGGEVEGKAEHKAEMKEMKGLEKELKSHESKPASKAHKGLKTGGVVNAQGGYKAGGIIKSEKGETMMHTAKADKSPAKTGEVKVGEAGYATGGVAKANAGGYKKGGKVKKFARGGMVDDGRPVEMPKKKPSAPVSITELSGTFKKGGRVKKMAEGGKVDLSKGAYDKTLAEPPAGMGFAKVVHGALDKLFGVKKPESVTKETVTVTK